MDGIKDIIKMNHVAYENVLESIKVNHGEHEVVVVEPKELYMAIDEDVNEPIKVKGS